MEEMNNRNDNAENITRLARKLETYIRGEFVVDQARQAASDLSQEEREEMTRQTNDDDMTLLCVAVERRRKSFVTFLLDECGADANLIGEGRTPLWWAAGGFRSANIRVVRILVDHDADVNAISKDNLTAVHQACTHHALATVQYLVEHGADIGIPDAQGYTCLMQALRTNSPNGPNPKPLCQYLLGQGASANAVNEDGDTALHCTLERRANKNVVRLLLRHGADASICNKYGHDAFQTAAMQYKLIILDYLIAKLQPTQQRRADLYALVGAQAVDLCNNFAAAKKYWKKSLRCQPPTPGCAPVVAPNPVYNGAVEARDISSLQAISRKDDALYMQALVCRERIIGSTHPETIRSLSKRALEYARNPDKYQRAIELYRHAAASCCACFVELVPSIIDVDSHERFCHLLWVKHVEDAASVRFGDAALVMRSMIEFSKYNSSSCSLLTGRILALFSITPVVNLLIRLASSDAERQSMKQMVRELVLKSRGAQDYSNILHSTVALDTVMQIFYTELMDLPNAAVVEELLEAGVNIDKVVAAGETPLHWALKNPPADASQRDAWLRVVDVLLRHGAHVDVRDKAGQAAADLLPPHVDKMQHITLQCLAARAIRQHGVEYRSILSKNQADFVALH